MKPNESDDKKLAAAVIVAVFVFVSFGSMALKDCLSSSLPQKDREAQRPPPPVDQVAPKKLIVPDVGAAAEEDDDVTPANDPVPPPAKPPSDPLKLRAAEPAWAYGSTPAQHSKGSTLFAAASEIAGPITDGFVICRARVAAESRGWSTVRFFADVGDAPAVTVEGPALGGFAFATISRTTLRDTDPIELTASIPGAQGFVEVLHHQAAFDGAMHVEKSERGDLACRTIATPELQARVARDLARADAKVSVLTQAKLAPQVEGWAYPTEDEHAAQTAVRDAASLVGWSDARVKKRVRAFDDATNALSTAKVRLFDDLHRRANDVAHSGSLTFALGSIDCANGASTSCGATLDITNGSSVPVPLATSGFRFALATRLGPTPIALEGTVPGTGRLRPSIPITVTPTPTVLQVCRRTSCDTLKLR